MKTKLLASLLLGSAFSQSAFGRIPPHHIFKDNSFDQFISTHQSKKTKKRRSKKK